jgi:hypothetical protein
LLLLRAWQLLRYQMQQQSLPPLR